MMCLVRLTRCQHLFVFVLFLYFLQPILSLLENKNSLVLLETEELEIKYRICIKKHTRFYVYDGNNIHKIKVFILLSIKKFIFD